MDDRTDPQYKLRMPAELHSKLKEAAQQNHRSLNAEMVARLERSFTPSNIPSAEYLRVASDEEFEEAADSAWVELRRIADVMVKRHRQKSPEDQSKP